MFVALNIYQCWLAHLHTSFTVRESDFGEIAKHLTALTPELLNSLANHPEHEGKISDLQLSQANALELLQRVRFFPTLFMWCKGNLVVAWEPLRDKPSSE